LTRRCAPRCPSARRWQGAPLGELQLDTDDRPVELQVRIAQLRDDAARSIVADPARFEGAHRRPSPRRRGAPRTIRRGGQVSGEQGTRGLLDVLVAGSEGGCVQLRSACPDEHHQ